LGVNGKESENFEAETGKSTLYPCCYGGAAMMMTKHAKRRMAQRGIKLKDAELIEIIGTPVDDGYLVRTKDCQSAEREIKQLLDRIRRLEGKRLVTVDGKLVTAFHIRRREERRLLRRSHKRDLEDVYYC
jgi:hypothetical protein